MRKTCITLCVLSMLLMSTALSVFATDIAVPGGICTIEGITYVADRQNRAIYAIQKEDSSLFLGQTDTVDPEGRPMAGYVDGSFSGVSFGEPWDIVPYRDGFLISDRENHALRYADLKKKKLYTLAGNGSAGFSDGTGRKAALHFPADLAVGDDGTIYVADSGNHAIRCVDKRGKLTTYVGGSEGTALGALAQTQLSYPTGLCFVDGTLYVADAGNHRILAIRDGICTLVAGATLSGDAAMEGDYLNGPSASARFSSPMDVAVQDDVIYVADTGNAVIRVIQDGYVTTLADEIQGTALISPDGFIQTEEGLYVVDSFHRTAAKIPDMPQAIVYTDTADSVYEEAIRFATCNSLMNGTGDGCFSPEETVTRGMMMTILARMDGMDTSVGEEWYTIGVQWGRDTGISDGTDPELAITREQLITMLYRYVGEPETGSDAVSVPDMDAVSAYAQKAVTWAVSCGIVSAEAVFQPAVNPSRGETAQFLMQFLLHM